VTELRRRCGDDSATELRRRDSGGERGEDGTVAIVLAIGNEDIVSEGINWSWSSGKRLLVSFPPSSGALILDLLDRKMGEIGRPFLPQHKKKPKIRARTPARPHAHTTHQS
jgi:hypothetical protein